MLKAIAICVHCGEREEIEHIDESILPKVCKRCGQVMMLTTPEYEKRGERKEETRAQTPQPGSIYPAPPYPAYPPVYYPMYQRPHMRYDAIISMLLSLTGVLGLVFWLAFFLVAYASGDINIDTSDPGSTVAFGFSSLMLISSMFALVGGYMAKKKNYEITLVASVFGILSFGYLIGSIFSLVALSLTFSHPEDFTNER